MTPQLPEEGLIESAATIVGVVESLPVAARELLMKTPSETSKIVTIQVVKKD
jgi:hypothetical protein